MSVAYGVEESTLKKTPGWLTTSVLPGENGMCVVYGHRNRNHLKILEKATVGDIITATKDGIAYTYAVSDVAIYESTSDWRLPTLDGSTLVLVTCYPLRYSGHAPGKYMVTAQLVG
ncbi:MAG: class D sortase [Christensenellaceae bacterium]|nr:class D sortase [Christensenellaceae bacterium]